jgi:hypothetical protein
MSTHTAVITGIATGDRRGENATTLLSWAVSITCNPGSPDTKRSKYAPGVRHDSTDFVTECRAINVVSHVGQNITEHRGWKIDARTTRHPGYAISVSRTRPRMEAKNNPREALNWGLSAAC